MCWDYKKFSHGLVAAEWYETRRRNTMISHYNYRLNPNIRKGVCAISGIPYEFPACFYQLDKC